MAQTTERIVAIGTSTGGTQALEAVLTALAARLPRHRDRAAHAGEIHRRICRTAERPVPDRGAGKRKNNDRVIPGRALIAPGGKHMLLKRSGAQYHVEVMDGPLVNRHRPSVDVLFRSVAKFAGQKRARHHHDRHG